MRVAIIHDYLREYGGAERVVEVLHNIFPQAPVFVAYYHPQGLGVHQQRFKSWDIRSSWLQKVPFANSIISPLRIISPRLFESFDLSEFDVVISSSAIYFAKAVKTHKKQLHLAYIHTPPKYLYGYTTSFNYKKRWYTRVGAEVLNHFLRLMDYKTSQRPDILIANSKAVQQRIKKFYRRDSVLIHPPVNVEFFKQNRGVGEGSYFLSVSRLWKGKGVDVVIEACAKLNLPLKVIGTGPELDELKAQGEKLKADVEFLGQVTDADLPSLYSGASALILNAEDEDFGITAVECMASGTPVIALAKGGYLETVLKGKTGEFFKQPTAESLIQILKDFDYTKYKVEDCIKQAEKFSYQQFEKQLFKLIEKEKR